MPHAFDAVIAQPGAVTIIVAMLVIGRIAITYIKATAPQNRR
jgi:hypothetical protein